MNRALFQYWLGFYETVKEYCLINILINWPPGQLSLLLFKNHSVPIWFPIVKALNFLECFMHFVLILGALSEQVIVMVKILALC